jgi:hypothetical protein
VIASLLRTANPACMSTRISACAIFQLEQAQDTRKQLIDMQRLILSAAFVPNEDLEVNGKRMTYRVIKAPRKKLPGLSPKIVSQFTFWIDEKGGVIRKIAEHTEGPLRPNHPEDHYVSERTVLFNVSVKLRCMNSRRGRVPPRDFLVRS